MNKNIRVGIYFNGFIHCSFPRGKRIHMVYPQNDKRTLCGVDTATAAGSTKPKPTCRTCSGLWAYRNAIA